MHFRESRAALGAPSRDTHFDPAPYVATAVHGADTALLDMRSERYYTLDVVGSRIWALLASGCSVGETASRIAEEFDASMTKIESDLRALLERLERTALIGRREERGASSGSDQTAWSGRDGGAR